MFFFSACQQKRSDFIPLSTSQFEETIFPTFCPITKAPEIGFENLKHSNHIPARKNKLETRLSPGDVIQIFIETDPIFSGRYTLDLYGKVNLPYIPPISLLAASEKQAEGIIKTHLQTTRIYQKNSFNLSVRILHLASAKIFISGAVFYPGQVVINDKDLSKTLKPQEQTIGDYALGRSLATALKAAGGVKPNADVENIMLVRNGKHYFFNMKGAFSGEPFEDIQLVSDDQVFIPKLECYNFMLAKPTAITQPGIRIYISNVTKEAPNVIPDLMRLPYGTRLSHALASASCIGGSAYINAPRYVMLIRHTSEGGYAVLKRSIEDLVRSPERLSENPLIINPLLFPDDVVACYDSKITNIREILSFISETLLPFATLNALTK